MLLKQNLYLSNTIKNTSFIIHVLPPYFTGTADVSNTSQFDFPSPSSSVYSQNSRFKK